jgi:hypothetical protein
MLQGSLAQIPAKLLHGHSARTDASVGGQNDLIRKIAVEPALAVLPFPPRHTHKRGSPKPEILRHLAEALEDHRVFELAKVRITTARESNRPDIGS